MSSPSLRPTRRKLGPGIAWTPGSDAYYIVAAMLRGAGTAAPLHVTQAAIQDLEANLQGSISALPFGLLAGALCVCPVTKLEYLLIDQITPSSSELTAEDPAGQLATELRALASSVERKGKVPIGWYMGGMDGELDLDAEAASMHREVFPHAFQVVLLHHESSRVERAAFIRYAVMSARFYPIPFVELLPESSSRGRPSEHRTAVRWTNYRTAEPVERLDTSPATPRQPAPANERPMSSPRNSVKAWLEPLRRRSASTDVPPAQPQPAALPSRPSASATLPAPTPARSRSAEIVATVQSAVRVAPLPPPPEAAPSAPRPSAPAPAAAPLAAAAPPTAAARPAASLPAAAVEAQSPARASETASPDRAPVREVFINGVLVPLPEQLLATDGVPVAAWRARALSLALGTLVVLLGGFALYLIAR